MENSHNGSISGDKVSIERHNATHLMDKYKCNDRLNKKISRPKKYKKSCAPKVNLVFLLLFNGSVFFSLVQRCIVKKIILSRNIQTVFICGRIYSGVAPHEKRILVYIHMLHNVSPSGINYNFRRY